MIFDIDSDVQILQELCSTQKLYINAKFLLKTTAQTL
jgi:hypothetical protein